MKIPTLIVLACLSLALFSLIAIAHAQLPPKPLPTDGITVTFTIEKNGDRQNYESRGIQNTIDLRNAFWEAANYFGSEERFFRQVDHSGDEEITNVTR